MPDGLRRYHDFDHDHFITFTCYRRLAFLKDAQACEVFEDVLEACRQRYRFAVYAYVVMPEHVHLLIGKPEEGTVASAVNVLKTQSSKRLKTTQEQFWQTRYYDRNIITSAEFIEKRRYIHRNPVAEGLVLAPEDWAWSSYRQYANAEPGRVTIPRFWV